MNWAELREFLEKENERYSSGEMARHEQIRLSKEPASLRRARRLAGEFAARNAIDEACRHFAAHGNWPSMDTDATLYAHDRWIFALWFSRWLGEAGSFSGERQKSEWLVWLLVDGWAEVGSWRWRLSQQT